MFRSAKQLNCPVVPTLSKSYLRKIYTTFMSFKQCVRPAKASFSHLNINIVNKDKTATTPAFLRLFPCTAIRPD